jgi:beta-galactosidase
VNGRTVGYSVNSCNAAEFDLTKYVQPGTNTLAVEVYRFTSGSYLENQDMWRLIGPRKCCTGNGSLRCFTLLPAA